MICEPGISIQFNHSSKIKILPMYKNEKRKTEKIMLVIKKLLGSESNPTANEIKPIISIGISAKRLKLIKKYQTSINEMLIFPPSFTRKIINKSPKHYICNISINLFIIFFVIFFSHQIYNFVHFWLVIKSDIIW